MSNKPTDKIEIEFYVDREGKCPFDKWFKKIKDNQTKARIYIRLDRLQMGNFGDCKTLDEELFELRMTFGGGVRIYFTKIKTKLVILLTGGNKSTQTKDISLAKKHLIGLKAQKKEV